MACNHSHSYKAHSGNNRANLAFTILLHSFVQQLLSNSFLILLWGNCLLCTVGFSCNANNSSLQNARHTATSLNSASRYIGTITTLGMGDPMEGYMMVYPDPLYQKRKWRQFLAKVRLLYDQPSMQHLLYIMAYDCHGAVRLKRIDAHASDHTATTDSMDDATPNWKEYGITPFMLCQGSSFGNKPIFTLDLNGVTFQHSAQLGFILAQNNSSPVHLVKYLVEKEIPWPDKPHTSTPIQDYLILPGAIGKRILHSEPVFDATIDLNSYTAIYCYLKRGHHYCFVPLDLLRNSIAQPQFYGLPYSNKAEHPDVSPKSCASAITSPPYTSKSAATNPLPVKGNNGSMQEIPKVAIHEMPQSPKNSSSRPQQLVTPSRSTYHALNKEINNAEIQQKILPETLKCIERLKRNQEHIISLIAILTSNDAVKNIIRPNSVNGIASALRSALETIEELQSALKLEKAYQLGIAYSRPTNLNNKRIAVIQVLENLKKAIYEEYREVKSVANSLALLIEHLEMMYGTLFNVFRIDEIDSIERSVKQLFIGDHMKLKKEKARTTIDQLYDITTHQKTAVRNFINAVSDVEKTLASIEKDLATLIGNPLQAIAGKIGISNLKIALKLKGNIAVVEGKVKNTKCIERIIMDLALEEEAIKEMQAILNSIDLKTKKIEIAKKIEEAVNNIFELEEELKIKMELKSKEMVDQIALLQEALLKMKKMDI